MIFNCLKLRFALFFHPKALAIPPRRFLYKLIFVFDFGITLAYVWGNVGVFAEINFVKMNKYARVSCWFWIHQGVLLSHCEKYFQNHAYWFLISFFTFHSFFLKKLSSEKCKSMLSTDVFGKKVKNLVKIPPKNSVFGAQKLKNSKKLLKKGIIFRQIFSFFAKLCTQVGCLRQQNWNGAARNCL